MAGTVLVPAFFPVSRQPEPFLALNTLILHSIPPFLFTNIRSIGREIKTTKSKQMRDHHKALTALNWDDLKIFLAVASAGSVRAAAPALGVNQSTVSRRIHSLEKELDTRLFEKLPSGYTITEVGRKVLNHAKRIAHEFTELNQQILSRNSDLDGIIRLTVCTPFLSNLMMRDLAEFGQQYPSIKIEILSSEHELNLSKREADIAVRVTDQPPEHLVGRRISAYAQTIYASHEYVDQFKAGLHDGHLRWLARIDPVQIKDYALHAAYSQAPCHHHIDSMALQYEAAKAGMGMALLPCFIGDRDTSLQRMPMVRPANASAVWLLMHPDSRKSARLQTFYAFLRERLLSHAELFEGKQNMRESLNRT